MRSLRSASRSACWLALGVLAAACNDTTNPTSTRRAAPDRASTALAEGEHVCGGGLSALPGSMSLNVNDAQILTVFAQICDDNGYLRTDTDPPGASLSSTAPAIVSVSSSAPATAVGVSEGSAAILISMDGQSTSVPVTVFGPSHVTTVTVSPSSVSLAHGQTTQLTATAKDQYGQPMSGVTFAWSSSNPSAATVSSTGLVTAIAQGNATITATANGVSGASSIAVDPTAPFSVTINGPESAFLTSPSKLLSFTSQVSNPPGAVTYAWTVERPDGSIDPLSSNPSINYTVTCSSRPDIILRLTATSGSSVAHASIDVFVSAARNVCPN